MTEPPRCVLVSFYFPPASTAGAIRAAALGSFLAERGWSVTVLCAAHDSGPKDDSLMSMISSINVHRIHCPTLYRKPAQGNTQGLSGETKSRSIIGAIVHKVGSLLDRYLFVPDRMILWLPWLIPCLSRKVQELKPAIIVCTGPPFSSFIGTIIGAKKSGSPVIFDYRDPWTLFPDWLFDDDLNVRKSRGSSLRLKLERQLESWTLSHCSGISAVTPRLLAHVSRLAKQGVPTVLARNGIVREAVLEAKHAFHTPEDPDVISIYHLGNFYGLQGARYFLTGLYWLATHDVELYQRLRISFYGSFRPEDWSLARSLGVTSCLKLGGPISYKEGLAVLCCADILLLCLPPSINTECWIPMKTYPYLASGKPILAVIPQGELWEYLEGVADVVRAEPSSPESIGRAISQISKNWGHRKERWEEHSFHMTLASLAGLLTDIAKERRESAY